MDALLAAFGGSTSPQAVIGPLGRPVTARFGVVADLAVGIVELAEACGLALVPAVKRDPTRTTTFGVGQLIAQAAARGCGDIIVCIGGSATVDGGAGLAQALGARFFDDRGRLIQDPITGSVLMQIGRFEPPRGLPRIRVACDVTNPLLGPQGAAAVYGPQKGASPQQVLELDRGLAHLARIVGGDPDQPGAGAAGGAGFGLAAICGAKLERGIDLVLETIGFEGKCDGAALVLTGEGRLDSQSLFGKACLGVAAAAGRVGVPTIAIVGSTGPGFEQCIDPSRPDRLRACQSLADRYGNERAMNEAATLLEELTSQVVGDALANP
jgi:glycerate kinase